MTTLVFANNVSTTLAATASSSATALTLASTANLPTIPAGQAWALTLNDAATGQVYEVVYVTAISGAVLTVQRGQEGTTAQTWAIGDYAFSGPTAGQMAGMAQHGEVQAQPGNYAADTGAVNALVAALSPAPTALTTGLTVRILAANTNTGNVTLNLNGLGAKPVYTPQGNNIVPGGLIAGQLVTLCYNATAGAWVWQGYSNIAKPLAASAQGNPGTGGGALTVTISLTVPAGQSGQLVVIGSRVVSTPTSASVGRAWMSINGPVPTLDSTAYAVAHSYSQAASAGAYTIQYSSDGMGVPYTLYVTAFFLPNPSV